MSIGLLALLDDVAALIKVAAASLDDIPAQVAKTSGKVSGIVIDDAAVTPKYVVGLDPKRELSIIWSITKKSLFNKMVILAPAALVLGYFVPWIITPILMIGGSYLCFEGFEKVHSILIKKNKDEVSEDAIEKISPEDLEKIRINSAVRTDFILSAEIVAIIYATIESGNLLNKIVILYIVAILITITVYGSVALIVKADDAGLYLAKNSKQSWLRKLGASIVKGMPGFLKWLSYVGTVAMLWVGAGIIVHGLPPLHHVLVGLTSALSFLPGVLVGLTEIIILALCGLVFGFIVEKFVHGAMPLIKKYRKQ